MTTIRERIETAKKEPFSDIGWALIEQWGNGNLVPADDPEALIRALNEKCDIGSHEGQVRAIVRVNALRHGYVPADEVDARIAEAVAARDEKWATVAEESAASNRVDAQTLPRHTSNPQMAKAMLEARAIALENLAATIRKGGDHDG